MRLLGSVFAVLLAAPAFAQAPYVTAAVGMDIARFSGVDTPFAGHETLGGEAPGVSLRVGTSLGSNWGVELGFTRPAALETETSFGFPISIATGASSILPVVQQTTRRERRDTSLETAAWVAQSIGARVELVYLGGVAFNHTSEEIRYEIGQRVTGLILPIPNTIRSTAYGVSPLLGFDARIGLTDHVRLVPGIRLQGVGDGISGASGWIARPAIGLAWQF